MFLFSWRTLACSETTPWLVRMSASYLFNVSHLQRKGPSCSLSSSFLLDFTQSLRHWALNWAPEKSPSSLLDILSPHWTLFLWIIISCCSNTKLKNWSLDTFVDGAELHHAACCRVSRRKRKETNKTALCRVLDSFLFNGLMNDREVEVKTNSCRTSGGVTHIVLIII